MPKDRQSVKSAAEGIINTFGLNATGENVNKVIDIISPKFGESTEYSKQRAQTELGGICKTGIKGKRETFRRD